MRTIAQRDAQAAEAQKDSEARGVRQQIRDETSEQWLTRSEEQRWLLVLQAIKALDRGI